MDLYDDRLVATNSWNLVCLNLNEMLKESKWEIFLYYAYKLYLIVYANKTFVVQIKKKDK